ncbi:hypothetical protein SD80_007280 [Scytonema tolypothrichoides VB-61278]|nr:hypothetical protein SD80_007280 [Scytonema tolypothrichoides VB-61278]
MQNKKWFKRCWQTLAVGSGLIAAALGLDILVSRSLYHPLTYAYNSFSWLLCKKSSAPSCKATVLSASPALAAGKNGVVATSQHEASEVGLQILKRGGNAVDAAVAVGYALAVTDPCCGNIGGGGFMLIYLANGKKTFINFREKAPLKASKNMYLDKQGKVISNLSKKGYLAVAVPGTVKGLEQALSEYGTMTRATVMAPAIELAEKGFILQRGDVDILNFSTKAFQKQPNIASIFLKDGKSYVYSNMTSTEGTNTTHYSITDRFGNAVSVTYTINSYFGAGVIAGKTGFFLNNEMDDFASKVGAPNQFGLVQGNANTIAPGKQPLSSMSPTIVTQKGKVLMVRK